MMASSSVGTMAGCLVGCWAELTVDGSVWSWARKTADCSVGKTDSEKAGCSVPS